MGDDRAIHREVQLLRHNAFEVAGYLRQAGMLFAFNHPLHFYRGQLPLERYLALVDAAPAIETRNGAMLAAHNALVQRLASARGGPNRGSDAHTLHRVGRTWTEAPGRTREEFLANVAAGRGRVGDDHGSMAALAADIYGVIGRYWLSLIGLERPEIGLPAGPGPGLFAGVGSIRVHPLRHRGTIQGAGAPLGGALRPRSALEPFEDVPRHVDSPRGDAPPLALRPAACQPSSP